MNQTAIFWPVIAQVFLVGVIYALLARRRGAAIASGTARLSQFRENRDEPAESLFVHNNLLNQFQLPVLFYVVCLCLYATHGATWFAVVLAWLFVASRYAHAVIHVTSNRVRLRGPVFMLGFVMTALMWVAFALHLAGVL